MLFRSARERVSYITEKEANDGMHAFHDPLLKLDLLCVGHHMVCVVCVFSVSPVVPWPD